MEPVNNMQAHIDGQAPARRIGYLIAFVVILCGCLSLIAVTLIFNRESVKLAQTSWHLQSNGVTTNGTVVEVEQYSGVHTYSSSTFKLFVEYVVDGQTYTIESNTFYPTRSSSWVGETMPIIYDPADPSIGQIDSFDERWFGLISLLPF